MKILAIDTSSKLCGVCILEDCEEIFRIDRITDKSHSERLMPIIYETFSNVSFNLKDINLIVCDKGPGSFTGIRIGIATAKAFLDSLNIPAIGISSLEALAYNVNTEGLICSLLDSKNDNCYFALYELKNSEYKEIEKPQAVSISELIEILAKFNKKITFVGDGVDVFQKRISSEINNPTFSSANEINSFNLGRAGFSKYSNGISDTLLPMYLRKPQAQRQLEEKLKKGL